MMRIFQVDVGFFKWKIRVGGQKPSGPIFLYFLNRKGKGQGIYKFFFSFSRIHICLAYIYFFLRAVACSCITRMNQKNGSDIQNCVASLAVCVRAHQERRQFFQVVVEEKKPHSHEPPSLNLGALQLCCAVRLPLPQRVNGATIQGTIHSPAKRDDK